MIQRKASLVLASLIIITLTFTFFWQILLTNLILSGVDIFLYFYPYKAYTADLLRQGRLPLWNPHLFMGAPLLANSQVGLFYPPNWLLIWLDAPKQVAWSIGLHIALAGIFMLAFTRHGLRLSRFAAMLAALLFAFGGYVGAQVEHINQLQAAAWLPLLFLLYDLGQQRQPGLFWFFLLALAIALMLLAGHAQTTFIALFGLGLYALWQALFERPPDARSNFSMAQQGSAIPDSHPARPHLHRLRSITAALLRYLAPLALAAIVAAALAAIQLLPTAELSSRSIRSQGLTFRETVSFSLRPTNLHYSLLPPFNLDLTGPLGQAFSEWVAYIGVSGLILAVLGLLTAFESRLARCFAFISGSGLILSLGTFTGPLYLALYKFVPGFNLFRVPARWLLLYAFGAAILAALGLEAVRDPIELRQRLTVLWRWLQFARHRLLLPLMPPLLLLSLILWKTPPLPTLLAWLLLALVAFGLIYAAVTRQDMPDPPRSAHKFASRPENRRRHNLAELFTDRLVAWLHYVLRFTFYAVNPNSSLPLILVTLSLFELFWAAQSLNYNQPTAPQAYHSMRNAIAFLLTHDPPGQSAPPHRFLSLSGITYDPGDLADLRHIFGRHLSEKALYDLIVATKEKEVLFFNLPMLYGLHSVDGYDGGILPLARFVTLQRLFLPPDDLSIDGRLREKLRFVPANHLLSLLNTRWIITDKQFDVWIDGIFYDLQFPARLAPGQSIATTDIPGFPPTAIGLVSHLEGAADLPDDSPVAEIMLSFAGGEHQSFTLKAGRDTAVGNYPTLEEAQVAHTQARIGVTWPYQAEGVDYISVHSLAAPQPVTEISVSALLPAGQFVLRGITLIHQPTNTSRSLLLSTEGDYGLVHSGDVKIYENRSVLPRAFIAHQAHLVPDDMAAINLMQSRQFDPRQSWVQVVEGNSPASIMTRGEPSLQDSAQIVSYAPERVEIWVSLDSPGWLILTDTHYPGWQATIDGQPTDIIPADILFRAVELPQGSHTVVFQFNPASFQSGLLISALTLIALIIGLTVTGKNRRQSLKRGKNLS